MINVEKTELMTKAVRYEKSEGNYTLYLHRRFGHGFSLLACAKFFVSGLVSYIIILVLIFAGIRQLPSEPEPLSEHPAAVIIIAVSAGIILSFLYTVAAYRYSLRKYENVRSSMREYNLDIQRITEIKDTQMEENEVS